MYAYDKSVPRQSLAFLEEEEGPLPASTGGTDQADRPRANPKAKTKKTKSLAERVKAALRAGTDKISEAKGHLAWYACTRTSVHVYIYIYICTYYLTNMMWMLLYIFLGFLFFYFLWQRAFLTFLSCCPLGWAKKMAENKVPDTMVAAILGSLDPKSAGVMEAHAKLQEVQAAGEDAATEAAIVALSEAIAAYNEATVHARLHSKPSKPAAKPGAKAKGKAKAKSRADEPES